MINLKFDSVANLLKYCKNLIFLFRPFTLFLYLIVSILVMTASIMYNNVELNSNLWINIIIAGFTLVLIYAASNTINQASDWKSDRISKPNRPIPKGAIKVADAHSIAFIIFLLAILLSIKVNVLFGSIVFMIAFFSITYSLPPRFKKYLFINQIWISIPRGILGILAAWSVFGNPFNPTPVIIGLIATTFLIGGIATKDIRDIEADKKTGVKTLMNTFGIQKTAFICLPFLIIPFVFVPLLIKIDLLEWYFWPLTLMIIPSCFIYYNMKNDLKNNIIKDTTAWSFIYAEYMFLVLGFSLCTIFNNSFFC